MARTDLLTPVGRLVMGSLYKPQTTDLEGRPLTIKSGPQAGQPRVDYFFALAVPKGAEQHWSQTEWGAKIWAAGHNGFPQGQANAPTFAWKVVDGDSQVPNRQGRKPCDREGYPGHWVLSFSSGFAPKIYTADGSQPFAEPDAVKLGYYVQVFGSVDDNGSLQQPGVFLNHGMIAFAGYGQEIILGPDATAVGFGQGVALPPGASATPVGGMSQPPAVPGAPMPSPVAPPAPVPPAPAAPIQVTPNPGFLNVPPVPAAPIAPPARQMTAKAAGSSYEQMIGAGWTDALLIQEGMMQA